MNPVQYMEHEKCIKLKQNAIKTCFHLIEEMSLFFVQFA
jgi:hypothetical protein